jgi:hypothetical protein
MQGIQAMPENVELIRQRLRKMSDLDYASTVERRGTWRTLGRTSARPIPPSKFS